MRRRYYRGRDVARALDIEELRQMALRRLPGFSSEYLEGGSDDERTLQRNRDVFGEHRFVHRIGQGVAKRSLASTVLGGAVDMPMVIGPTGFNGLLWKHGDIELARAAKQRNIPFAISTVSNDSVEDIAKHAGGRLWMQMLVLRDPVAFERLLSRAEDSGCEALILTLDGPVLGNRAWHTRTFSRPGVLSLRSKLDVLMHVRWLFGVFLPGGLPGFGNLAEFLPPHQRTKPLDGAAYLTSQGNPGVTWEQLKAVRDRWKRKLIIKGVVALPDVEAAVQLGADAVVLSNHGGRQLDSDVSPMDVLERVVAAFGARIEVLIDGGFRRGTDVAKALALGARAVLLGRATAYGLAAGGQAGATRALEILRGELDTTLALLGCTSVDQLSPGALFGRAEADRTPRSARDSLAV